MRGTAGHVGMSVEDFLVLVHAFALGTAGQAHWQLLRNKHQAVRSMSWRQKMFSSLAGHICSCKDTSDGKMGLLVMTYPQEQLHERLGGCMDQVLCQAPQVH